MQKNGSVQQWIPILQIYENGLIKLKDNKIIKILKVYPINYNLKSDLEKRAILNSYKIFLKTCNFDIQIIIQSNKENLNHIISKVNNQNKIENENKIKNISRKYINYIEKCNDIQKSAARKFYIIIKNINLNENAYDELNEKYLKIKENLARCGNYVEEIKSIEESKEILKNFFNK